MAAHSGQSHHPPCSWKDEPVDVDYTQKGKGKGDFGFKGKGKGYIQRNQMQMIVSGIKGMKGGGKGCGKEGFGKGFGKGKDTADGQHSSLL